MKKFIVAMAMLTIGAIALMSASNDRQPDALPTKAKQDTTMITEPSLLGLYNDCNPLHITICEKILDECVKCGILDSWGARYYELVKKNCPKVSLYIVLIEECFQEDMFECIQENSDLWEPYLREILIPRGLI